MIHKFIEIIYNKIYYRKIIKMLLYHSLFNNYYNWIVISW